MIRIKGTILELLVTPPTMFDAFGARDPAYDLSDPESMVAFEEHLAQLMP